MGIFDDVTALIGRGMDTADKKTQIFKLQSELSRLGSCKEKVLADLGRAILIEEGANSAFSSAYADQIKAIGELEQQEESLRQQIEALQRNESLVSGAAMQVASAMVQGHSCPACGSPVVLEAMFCPSCGDNLAALKSQFRKCSNCNEYYSADYVFCARCGSKTEELEIAVAHPTSMGNEPEFDTRDRLPSTGVPHGMTGGDEMPVAAGICQECRAPLKPDAAFCGACGAKVQR